MRTEAGAVKRFLCLCSPPAQPHLHINDCRAAAEKKRRWGRGAEQLFCFSNQGRHRFSQAVLPEYRLVATAILPRANGQNFAIRRFRLADSETGLSLDTACNGRFAQLPSAQRSVACCTLKGPINHCNRNWSVCDRPNISTTHHNDKDPRHIKWKVACIH